MLIRRSPLRLARAQRALDRSPGRATDRMNSGSDTPQLSDIPVILNRRARSPRGRVPGSSFSVGLN